MGRWLRYELIAIDEVGYVPLAEVGAELLFQVISEPQSLDKPGAEVRSRAV
jgi:hypothetical protein